MRKKFKALTVIALCILLTACGSEKYDSASYSSVSESSVAGGNGFYDSDVYTEETTTYDKTEVTDAARKLIKTYSMSVETENFDSLIPAIEARVSEMGGYIEQLNTYYGEKYSGNTNRNSSLTIRIPKGKEDAFISYVGNSSNITRQSLDVSDVTLSYVDVETRKNSYVAERDRLLELLESAESIDDIITIEARLSEVRYYLESMESQLRTMDNLIDYSTIYLSVYEVKQYTEPEPETYGQRIARSFKNGIENFTDGLKEFSIWFVGALPTLLFFGIIIYIVVIVRKKIKAAKLAKSGSKETKKEEKETKVEWKDPSADSKEKGK